MEHFAPLESMINMLPGVASFLSNDDKEFHQTAAIIDSMTPKKREHPEIIVWRRKTRLAGGSGCEAQDVFRMLRSFENINETRVRFPPFDDWFDPQGPA